MKNQKKSKKTEKLCGNCSDCCKYVALELDKPTDADDFENIIWYLHHKNVNVYIGWDNKWYLEFITPCQQLNKSGLCKIYEKRPKMCREYQQEDCTKYNDEPAEKFYFKSADDFKKYISNKK